MSRYNTLYIDFGIISAVSGNRVSSWNVLHVDTGVRLYQVCNSYLHLTVRMFDRSTRKLRP